MKKLRALRMMLSLILLFSAFTFTASCEEATANVTVKYHLSDCIFRFYKIADFSSEDRFSLDKTFSKYSDSVGLLEDTDNLSADELRILATTLDALTSKENISPDYEGATDEKGHISFSDVEKGLYLIVGQQLTVEDTVYTPLPVIISVPVMFDDGQPDLYDVVIEHTKYEESPLFEDVEIKVIKIWDSEKKNTPRPQKVTVELLQDEEVYDTVVLSVENDWEHQWKALPSGHYYEVMEKEIPDGYKMTVERDGNKYIVENTFYGEEDVPVIEDDDDDEDGDDTIISTGQLWWPVPLMAILGVVLVILGLIRRKQQKI